MVRRYILWGWHGLVELSDYKSLIFLLDVDSLDHNFCYYFCIPGFIGAVIISEVTSEYSMLDIYTPKFPD